MQPIVKTFSLSVVLSVVTLSPAWAERVLRVSSVAAQEGNVPITVHIEGGGVLIDFAPTDERITDISIDDPSQIVVDHCLVTKSCGDPPSPIIRLFRSAGINFQDIPAAKTTMLSVETIDAQGNYHSYPFPVTIGAGHSLVSKILIGEDDASDSLFIALRKHVGTMFKCSINTIVKAIKFVPLLPHPVFEDKPRKLCGGNTPAANVSHQCSILFKSGE